MPFSSTRPRRRTWWSLEPMLDARGFSLSLSVCDGITPSGSCFAPDSTSIAWDFGMVALMSGGMRWTTPTQASIQCPNPRVIKWQRLSRDNYEYHPRRMLNSSYLLPWLQQTSTTSHERINAGSATDSYQSTKPNELCGDDPMGWRYDTINKARCVAKWISNSDQERKNKQELSKNKNDRQRKFGRMSHAKGAWTEWKKTQRNIKYNVDTDDRARKLLIMTECYTITKASACRRVVQTGVGSTWRPASAHGRPCRMVLLPLPGSQETQNAACR